MQASNTIKQLHAGLQGQMVGVSEDNMAVQLSQLLSGDALHAAGGAHGHELRREDGEVRQLHGA